MRNILKYFANKIVITGYDKFCTTAPARKALLSYLVPPLLIPKPLLKMDVKFSNHGIAREIPRVLNELGFTVDIIHYDNISWVPKTKYDLFIGHAGINFQRISEHLPKETIRIYFATGIYWKEWNDRLAKRLGDVALRRGILFPNERFVKHSEEYANRIADGIICLGNEKAMKTFIGFKKVIGINNAVYPILHEESPSKDFEAGRKHFLFFSGRGNILKGLDLLLEAFYGTDLHLHICQHMQREFTEIYKREIHDNENIHLHGFVKMRSSKFKELANKCNWTISPTCAEGQPGAVLECMGYGLIPIFPQAANIDIHNYGIKLHDITVETIRSIILKASNMEIGVCQSMALLAAEDVKKNYTVELFRNNFKEAICKILYQV